MSDLGLLRLVDSPRVILKQAPLALALCQIKYSSLFDIKDQSVLEFKEAVKSKYPNARGGKVTEVTVGITPLDAELKKETKEIPQWQFTDQDDNWRIILSQDFLSLETRTYKDFDEFLDRLTEALQVLAAHIHPTSVSRIGLRYINEIRSKTLGDRYSWSDVIQHNLLGPLAISEFIENALQAVSIQQLTFRYPDNLGVNIHHGLLTGGTVVQGHKSPQDVDDAFYLLDFDVYRDFLYPQALEVDPEVITKTISEYHKVIYQLFRWSVTQEYISILEG